MEKEIIKNVLETEIEILKISRSSYNLAERKLIDLLRFISRAQLKAYPEDVKYLDYLLSHLNNTKELVSFLKNRELQYLKFTCVCMGVPENDFLFIFDLIDFYNGGLMDEDAFNQLLKTKIFHSVTNRAIVYSLLYRQRYENEFADDNIINELSVKYNLSKDKIKKELNLKQSANSTLRPYEIGETNISNKKTRDAIISGLEQAAVILKNMGENKKAIESINKDLDFLKK